MYGTRANPLSFFLSRNLNLRLTANNVYCVDTVMTQQESRLTPMRDLFTCTELPVMEDLKQLEEIVAKNEITDVIDMTNRACTSKTAEMEAESR